MSPDFNPVWIGAAALAAALAYAFWPRRQAAVAKVEALAQPLIRYEAPAPAAPVPPDPAHLIRSAFQAFREVGEIRGSSRVADRLGDRQAAAWEKEFGGLFSETKALPSPAEAPKATPPAA